MYIDRDLIDILVANVLVGICFVICASFEMAKIKSGNAPVKIKSENLIKPKIEIIVNDNKIDTLYIYEKS